MVMTGAWLIIVLPTLHGIHGRCSIAMFNCQRETNFITCRAMGKTALNKTVIFKAGGCF